MKSISKLKDEARRHEQREEWEKAIQAYLQVLRTADEGETEVELPLYNRVGDLCVRLGKPQEAVRHYEQAADRYADAGLYNNAIALCNKALRYSPDRLELIRKLGQFSASQGFITDARRYFLDYAERQFKAGKVTEALTALEDFANVSDDADIREMLGRQLHTHGRINDAVVELQRAHALRLRDGQTEQAAAIRDEILSIDPNATIEAGAPAPSTGPRQESVDLPGLVEIEPSFPDAAAEADAHVVDGLEAGALPGDGDDGVEPVELAGFESTGAADLPELEHDSGGTIEGLETTSLDFGTVEADVPTLDDLGLEREETTFDGTVTPTAGAFDLPTLDDPDTSSTALPTLDDDAGSAFDLPTLDDADSGLDLPMLDDPAQATDLPGLDDSAGSFDLPLLGDADASELPTLDDAVETDLPLLGDDEATGQAPDQNDGPTPDAPEAHAPDDFGLGGDLRIDLSSLGGPGGAFDLPSVPQEADPAAEDWSGAQSFDIPDLGDEALGIRSWEPEPDTFEIPSFEPEQPAEEPPVEDLTEELGGLPAAEAADDVEPASSETTEARGAAIEDGLDNAAEPLNIPAIELPTWDTGFAAGELDADDVDAEVDATLSEHDASDVAGLDQASSDFSESVDEPESTEPAWLDSTAGEEDEATPELPTFTYEDDVAGIDEIRADDDDLEEDPGAGVAEGSPADSLPGGLEEDDDPLDLASHLGTAGPARQRPSAPPAAPEVGSGATVDTVRPDEGAAVPDVTDTGDTDRSAGEPDTPADSDWLDDIADDEDEVAAEVGGSFTDDGAMLPQAADDTGVTDAAIGVEDVTGNAADEEAAAAEMAAAPAPRETSGSGDEGFIDLGALIASDTDEETTRFRVQETAPTGDEDRDFAELLSQFKSKVHQHLPPEDAAAHYDLGLAFKEMGLIDEAIGEFQIALRAGHMRLKVYEELGHCFLQKEQFNIAEKVLTRALTMKYEDELELLGVYYHLGRAYEALGRREQARDAYERVLGMDISFGDVTDRLARL